MVISAPSLVSSFAAVEEIVAVPAGEPFVIVVKNHIGSPRRELEVFTVAEVEAGTPIPTQVQIFNQVFTTFEAVFLTGTTARFYWNERVPNPTAPAIFQVDYDFSTNTPGTVSTVSFTGLDPFVLDARTTENPSNLVMTYVTPAGANAFRVSRNLGSTWGSEGIVDGPAAQVTSVEANFDDPLTLRENVQVLQRRL